MLIENSNHNFKSNQKVIKDIKIKKKEGMRQMVIESIKLLESMIPDVVDYNEYTETEAHKIEWESKVGLSERAVIFGILLVYVLMIVSFVIINLAFTNSGGI